VWDLALCGAGWVYVALTLCINFDSPLLAIGFPSVPMKNVVDGSFVFENTSMTEFAEKLSLLRGVDLPVTDATGIEGVFDITLKSAASAILQPDGPSLFTMIEKQLGLRLVSANAPFEVLIVDRVERPSENQAPLRWSDSASPASARARPISPASSAWRAASRNCQAWTAIAMSGSRSAPQREQMHEPRKRAWQTGH
jgi:hypothetical protein